MDLRTRVQILRLATCISHSANILRKGKNPTILPSVMNIKKDRLGSLMLIWQPFQKKKNSKLKPDKLRLLLAFVPSNSRRSTNKYIYSCEFNSNYLFCTHH